MSSPLLKIPGDSFWLRIANDIKRFFSGDSCVFSKLSTWVNEFKERKSCELISSPNIDDVDLIDANETRKYSNDFKKMAEINCLIESSINNQDQNKPDLRLACPTSNWLNAAFESTDITMQSATKLEVPTLIIRADPDYAVDPSGQTEFCDLTANCTILSAKAIGFVPGHELLIEVEPIRELFFKHLKNHVHEN